MNLALALARRGIRTGILDTDIFGPSIPSLLNLSGEPRLDDGMSPWEYMMVDTALGGLFFH